MRTKTQLYHYLLSFADTRLIKWYNNCVVDAFGDYSEQTIAVNNQEATIYWATLYGLEKLCSIMKNKNSRIFDEDLWIAVCGGENPYMITFSTFEEFLNIGDNKDCLLDYIATYPELLAELENMEEK